MDSSRRSAGPTSSQVWLDSTQIRTLAHPLRSRLLVTLRAGGPATATDLARALDTNTGATSYHLRQLAEVGLVVEDPQPGSGRQRWWRAAHQLSSWRGADFDDDPDARAASDWLVRNALRLHVEQAERWVTEQHRYPAEWRDAADLSDYLLRLTPQRLRQLTGELHEVVARYRDAAPPVDERHTAGDEPEGTEPVLLYLHGFPIPGGTSPAAVEADER